MSDTSLDGKVAVVTGAGAGLGRAEALALADAGARVVLNDLPGGADEAAEEIRSRGGEATVVAGDVGERATADAMMAAAVDGFGRLDIVVNNAGVTRDRMLFNMSDDEWDLVMKIHLRGHFLLSRNAAAHWRAQAKESGPVERSGREHRVRGVPQRPARTGQLRRRQGRHRRAHGLDRARDGEQRRARQRDLPTGADRDDRPGLRRGRVRPRGRPVLARCTSRRWSPTSPRPRQRRITGQVFVVYGGMVALVAAPVVEQRFDKAGALWTADDLDKQLGGYFDGRDPAVGFAADSIMKLTV